MIPSYLLNISTEIPPNSGSGDHLPRWILFLATIAAIFSTILSLSTVISQLKNYRKPHLQRFTVRILVMVPLFSLASLFSLYSLDLAFTSDLIRDMYEAFVIYCFFNLLVEYLGGERNLLILLSGRPPISHLPPVDFILPPLDPSDPFTFLALKRCILQYVQIKPILAILTAFLKTTGNYKDGSLEVSSGYSYISAIQNVSVSLSLYSLLLFYKATANDLKPFRPVPKFSAVKGILFFSFWQGVAVSILVAAGIVHSSRFSTEMLSLAIQDTLICFEMPGFALLHRYAFSFTDYIDQNHQFAGRLSFLHALRDTFGGKDIFLDTKTTITGTGFDYRTFEPADGAVHVGLGRERRVRAGLRYAEGGKVKYWLPMPGEESNGRKARNAEEYRLWKERQNDESEESDGDSLAFSEDDEVVENQYKDARTLPFGDFNYPIIDSSKEERRKADRFKELEEGKSHRKKGKGRAMEGNGRVIGYGSLAERRPAPTSSIPQVKNDVYAIGGSDDEEEKVEKISRSGAYDSIAEAEPVEDVESNRNRSKEAEFGNSKTKIDRISPLASTSTAVSSSNGSAIASRVDIGGIETVEAIENPMMVTENGKLASRVDYYDSSTQHHNPW